MERIVDPHWGVAGIGERSYMEVQFNANQAPLVKFGIVPIADSHDLKDRLLVAVFGEAKAATQIANLHSLTLSTASPRLLA
jgi:hypothetical protein